MNNALPETVCCLLCQGTVRSDKSRFRDHLVYQHGVFFDYDYLLASSMMDPGQKETVARTVSNYYSGVGNNDYQDYNIAPEMPQMTSISVASASQDHVTLREDVTSQDQGQVQGDQAWTSQGGGQGQGLKRERSDYLESDLSCAQCCSQFITNEAYQQHKVRGCQASAPEETSGTSAPSETAPASKRRPKTIACESCSKSFVSEQSKKIHAEKFHPAPEVSKKEEMTTEEQESATDHVNDTNEDVGNQTAEESTYYTDDNSFGGNDSSSFQSMDGQDTSSLLGQAETGQDVGNVTEEQAEEGDKTKAGERFACQFEGCDKSYTNSSNRLTHQKKAHGLLGPRAKTKAAKKQKLSTAEGDEEETTVSTTAASEQLLEEEPTAMETEPALEQGPGSSFLTDTSLGFDDPSEASDTETEPPAPADEEAARKKAFVDISVSKYFEKNPKIIATARGKSLEWFSPLPDDSVLPSGWKQRIVEREKPTGEKITTKHYLSPEDRVLKSGLAVIEYLRIRDGLEQEQLASIAAKLNVADKRFKELFSD